MRYIFSIMLLACIELSVLSQIQLHTYLDAGENNVSEGVFLHNGFRGSYQFDQITFESGILLQYAGNTPNFLNGFDMGAAREMTVREFPFQLKGFFMVNRFSDLIYETNWGIKLNTRKAAHFLFETGMNFKTYVINSSGIESLQGDVSKRKLRENFNLIYTVTAFLKQQPSSWNLGISVTNIDYFVFNQSTNPILSVQANYILKPNVSLHLEGWYKQAGVMNINANYFGYFFRGGVIYIIT